MKQGEGERKYKGRKEREIFYSKIYRKTKERARVKSDVNKNPRKERITEKGEGDSERQKKREKMKDEGGRRRRKRHVMQRRTLRKN